MRNENEPMPSWFNQIETFGPSKEIAEIEKAANERLEELAQAIISSIELRQIQSGEWILVIKYKFRIGDQGE